MFNVTRDTMLASRAGCARTARERTRGLIGRERLDPGEGLVIARCRQVHTFWMRFPIDVLFVDGRGAVVRTCRNLRPRRVSPVSWRARCAIELPAGTVEQSGTAPGDFISHE